MEDSAGEGLAREGVGQGYLSVGRSKTRREEEREVRLRSGFL